MSTSLTAEQRALIADLLGDVKPATDGLLVSFGKSVANRRDHAHPKHEDFFCLNLSSYMGERMAPVLRRLIDAEAERDELRARVAALEAAQKTARRAGYQRAIEVMRQERLPMSVGLLEAQLELDDLDAPEAHNTAPGPDAEAGGVVPTEAPREDKAAAAPDFFQPDHTYAYDADGFTAPELITEFRVVATTTHPDTGKRTAFGWLREGETTVWSPYSEPADEYPACWTDVTEGGVS